MAHPIAALAIAASPFVATQLTSGQPNPLRASFWHDDNDAKRGWTSSGAILTAGALGLAAYLAFKE
jgi:hypothetical protein